MMMPQAAVLPDVVSYSSALSACERKGEWTVALQLLAVMALAGLLFGVSCRVHCFGLWVFKN